MISDAALAERISAYLKATQGRDTKVVELVRIHGGASRETYRVKLDEGGRTWDGMAAVSRERARRATMMNVQASPRRQRSIA